MKTAKHRAAKAAKDRAQRKKIGKTLDLAAFMADFNRDTTSATYWSTNEKSLNPCRNPAKTQ